MDDIARTTLTDVRSIKLVLFSSRGRRVPHTLRTAGSYVLHYHPVQARR